MLKTGTLLLLGFTVSNFAYADRNVKFTGAFESGQIQAMQSKTSGPVTDAFFIHTLPHVQIGTESVMTTLGGAGPLTDWDTKVVTSEVVGSERVMPRKGNYFLRSALYFDKDYSELNGGKRSSPRSKIYMNGNDLRFNHDEEGYIGFSVFLPSNWEYETGTKGSRGTTMLLQVQSNGASYTQLSLRTYVPDGESVDHWFLHHHFDDKSAKHAETSKKIVYDLGPVTGDLGKWTDFVLRYRFNPFSVDTNPYAAGIKYSKSQKYQGNKGVLQLWKGKGAINEHGDRAMALKVDLENEPVGMVPHETAKISFHFRIYKYGWHENPTDVDGPVWVGFDEIRDGRVIEDGTGYVDVHPSTAPEPSDPLPPPDNPPNLPVTPPPAPDPPGGLIIVP